MVVSRVNVQVVDGAVMSSVQYLREFISERLTAAAEEIFTVFEKTIVQYEEEVDRQRRLLETGSKPDMEAHSIGQYRQTVPLVSFCFLHSDITTDRQTSTR